jgi:hypothetical protein
MQIKWSLRFCGGMVDRLFDCSSPKQVIKHIPTGQVFSRKISSLLKGSAMLIKIEKLLKLFSLKW